MDTADRYSRDIETEFSNFEWHDSKLINIHILSLPNRESKIAIEMELNSGNGTTRSALLELLRTCSVIIDFDLLGKAYVSHHISNAFCEMASMSNDPLVNQISKENSDDLFVFTIELISPGGKLRAIGEDFQLSFV